VLLGRLDVSHLHVGEGQAIHRLQVLGIDLVGLAQIVESPQAVALPSQYSAQVLESHRVPGVCGQGLTGGLLGPGQVALLLIGYAQGHAGVGVLGRNLQAAVQQLYAFVELAKVHIAEAQVVEEIGIFGIHGKQLLQVDAGLVHAAGGEELQSQVKVVHHGGNGKSQY